MGLQSLAPWNPLFTSSVATELETEPFVTFQFSNIDQNGLPHVRTCVFRGYLFNDRSTNVLLFTTDKRTNKFAEMMNNPNFEACFYFNKTKRQFRFNGVVKLLTNDLHPKTVIESRHREEIEYTNEQLNDTPINLLDTDFYSRCNGDSIEKPINYRLISPTQLKKKQDSMLCLQELLTNPLIPPTADEWVQEYERNWLNLSKALKRSYKKPQSGTLLTDEKIKLLDSINRGVDGISRNRDDVDPNFVVVCMFVKAADQLQLGSGGGNSDKRFLFKKSYDVEAWKEFEVCP
ncbi:hypothetical protein CANARDRAFT_5576 [[Candida] arabinofermentans NRRL YB-2248]|uniref:Pyridoxamine 5'-phosphate oxidase Alr4036 family FMN-binding domain-containing protein n=1 Tax=[Candida] arabinofermentans NRRL YB-2248 TaxID=983967 RepID=A0A1E4T995_9ASCO|nr:hypothetical protein CANARDRAFT_5576 [[Candida] arabinofermentans NRRL YB-2248]